MYDPTYAGVQGGGMLSTPPPNSGNYSYNSIMPTVPMTSPTTGLTGMADALINGYSQYLAAQNQKWQPTQLSSAAPQNNLGNLIGSWLNGSAGSGGASSAAPDPSTAGVY
jgi:hypothetical protein